MERRRVEVVGRRERMRVPRADRGERAAAAAARVTATAAAAAADPGKRAMILKDLQARRALLMAARGPLAAFSEADLLTAPAIGRELALACSRGVPEPGGGDGLWGRVARVPGAPAFAAYAALRDAALRRRDEGRAATRALPAIDAEVEALQSAEAGAPEAEQAAFPPLIAGGVAAVYAYLASAAAVDPAACMEPFRILAGIVGALDVQAALREPAPLVANLAAMFRRNSLPPGVCGAPAAAAELAALSASSLVALALARGTAGAVLEAAHALVALVDGGSSLLFPVPRALQVFCALARGVPTRTLVRPCVATLASSVGLGGAAAEALRPGAAACASDGAFLFVITRFDRAAGRQLCKIGTGYRATEAGRLYARADVAQGGDALAPLQLVVAGRRVLLQVAESLQLLAFSVDDLSHLPPVRLVLARGGGDDAAAVASAPCALFTAGDGTIGVLERRKWTPPAAADGARGVVELSVSGGELVPQSVSCCDAKHELVVSSSAAGGYIGGWSCNVCGADGAAGSERLHCSACSFDACLEHTVLSQKGAVMNLGRAALWECDTCHLRGSASVEAFLAAPAQARCVACARKSLKSATADPSPGARALPTVECTLHMCTLERDAAIETSASAPLLWPPTGADSRIGVAGDGVFDGQSGARLAPPLLMDGENAVPASFVAGNEELAVLVSATGAVYYVGNPRACGVVVGVAQVPVPCTFLPQRVRVVLVAVGQQHVLFLSSAGHVLSAGSDESSGLGRRVSKSGKLDVELPDRCVSIAAASERSAAVLANGDVYTWGQDSGHGELAWENVRLSMRRGGARKKQPTLIDAAFGVCVAQDKARTVALGAVHMVVCTAAGAVHTFGGDEQNQLGRNGPEPADAAAHHVLREFGGATAAEVSCGGGWHTVVLTTTGHVWCFGANDFGQLGCGDCEPRTGPVRVALPDTGSAIAVACGLQHALVLQSSSVYGWGRNAEQQLASVADEARGRADKVVVPGRVDFGVRMNWVGAGGHRSFCVPRLDPLPGSSLSRMTVVSGPGYLGCLSTVLCRSFGAGSDGRPDGHYADSAIEFPGLLHDSVVICNDLYNNCMWALGTAQEGAVTLLRFEASGDVARNRDAGASNSARLLSDPRHAVPMAPNATMTPYCAVVALLAALDLVVSTAAAGSSMGGIRTLILPPGRVGASAKSVLPSYEIASRYGTTHHGWALNSKVDTVAFEVDREVDLVGIGIFGAVAPSVVGQAWICEGYVVPRELRYMHLSYATRIGVRICFIGAARDRCRYTSSGPLLAKKSYNEAPVADRGVIPVIFDAPVRLVAGTVYSMSSATAGANGPYGRDGKSTIVHEGSKVTWTFHDTKDPVSNGTSAARGVLPEVYFRVISGAGGDDAGVHNCSSVDLRPLALEIDAAGLAYVLSLLEWALHALRDGGSGAERRTVAALAASTTLRILRENVRGDVPDAKRLAWRPNSVDSWNTLMADINRLLRCAIAELSGTVGESYFVALEASTALSAVFHRLHPSWREKLACLGDATTAYASSGGGRSGSSALLAAIICAVASCDGLSNALFGDDCPTQDHFGDVVRLLVSVSQSQSADSAVVATAVSFVCLVQSELAASILACTDGVPGSEGADTSSYGMRREVLFVRFVRVIDAIFGHLEALLESGALRAPSHDEAGVVSFVSSVVPLLCAHVGRVVSTDLGFAKLMLRRAILLVERLEAVDDHGGSVGGGAVYSWSPTVESEHPYVSASPRVWEVRFPSDVSWIELEFDARCATLQVEDNLSLYVDSSLAEEKRVGPAYYGQPGDVDPHWPCSRVVVPGSCVFIVFRNATDHVHDVNASKFGFALDVTGHAVDSGLVGRLRREFGRVASVCLVHVMTPPSTVVTPVSATADRLAASATTWDSASCVNVALSKESRVAESFAAEGLVKLSKTYSCGRVECEILVVKEIDGDQCVCYGVCLESHVQPKYKTAGTWVLRAYNGALYTGAVQGPTHASLKVRARRAFPLSCPPLLERSHVAQLKEGDRLKMVLDADRHTLSFAKNDEPAIEGFTGLPGSALVPCCIFYASKRVVELIGVRDVDELRAVTPASTAADTGAVGRVLSRSLFCGGLELDDDGRHGASESKGAEAATGASRFMKDFMDAGGSAGRLVQWLEASEGSMEPPQSQPQPVMVARGVAVSPIRVDDRSDGELESSVVPGLNGVGRLAIRCVYAALLWHHGLVADAVSAAMYLKFDACAQETVPPVLRALLALWNMCHGQFRAPLIAGESEDGAVATSDAGIGALGSSRRAVGVSRAALSSAPPPVPDAGVASPAGAAGLPGEVAEKGFLTSKTPRTVVFSPDAAYVLVRAKWETAGAPGGFPVSADGLQVGPARARAAVGRAVGAAVAPVAFAFCDGVWDGSLASAEARFYFEVEVIEASRMCIGLASVPMMARLVADGLSAGGVGALWYADDGTFMHNKVRVGGRPYTDGDVVGVGWVPSADVVFYTLNGRWVGVQYASFCGSKASVVGAVAAADGGCFMANFGGRAFVSRDMERLRLAAVHAARTDAPPSPAVRAAGGSPSWGALEQQPRILRAAEVEAHARLLLKVKSAGPLFAASVRADERRSADRALAMGAERSLASSAASEVPGGRAVVDEAPAEVLMTPGRTLLPRPDIDVPLLRQRSADGPLATAPAPIPLVRAWSYGGAPTASMVSPPNGRPAATLLQRPSNSLAVAAAGCAPLTRELFAFCASAVAVESVAAALSRAAERASDLIFAVDAATSLLGRLRDPEATAVLLWHLAGILTLDLSPPGGAAESPPLPPGAAAAAAAEAAAPAGAPPAASRGTAARTGATTAAGDGGGSDAGVGRRHCTAHVLVAQTLGCGAGLVGHMRRRVHALLSAISEHLEGPRGPPTRSDGGGCAGATAVVQVAALRCWNLALDRLDKEFVHRSDLFGRLHSVIAAAGGGDARQGGGAAVPAPWVDVTARFKFSVNGGEERRGALTDASTETFWEAREADEAVGKCRWARGDLGADDPGVDVALVAVYVDGARDAENRARRVEVRVGGGVDSLARIGEEAAPGEKYVGWLLFAPDAAPVRARVVQVRVSAGRVRGVRVFAAAASPPASGGVGVCQRLEHVALGLFRHLVGQVFEGMAEGAAAGAAAATAPALEESGAPPPPPPRGLVAPADGDGGAEGSYLRQRVAGLLFRCNETSLQARLFALMTSELSRLASAAAAATAAATVAIQPAVAGRALPATDAYVYEVVSILLSLSDAEAGRARLCTPFVVAALLTLLPRSTPRVQRAVLAVLRRVLPDVPPARLDGAVRAPLSLLSAGLASASAAADAAGSAARGGGGGGGGGGEGGGGGGGATLEGIVSQQAPSSGPGAGLAALLLLLAPALTLEVRGRAGDGGRPVRVVAAPPPGIAPGALPPEVAAEVTELLRLAAGGGAGPAWRAAVDAGAAAAFAQLPSLLDACARRPALATLLPQLWFALSCLAAFKTGNAVATGAAVAAAGGRDGTAAAAAAVLCENHGDGATAAKWECAECADERRLCDECDHVVHLAPRRRAHARAALGPPPRAALVVEASDGATHARLPWLLISVYPSRCRAVIEFKVDAPRGGGGGGRDACRFCSTPLSAANRAPDSPSPALERCCSSPDCLRRRAAFCTRTLDCGHACGGVRGEEACLPCFEGCSGLRLVADEDCAVCYTEGLTAAPCVRLGCGHAFHHECLLGVLQRRWTGPRISFGSLACPLCRREMEHPSLAEAMGPLLKLRQQVVDKALLRLRYENLDSQPELATPGGRWFGDPAGFAIDRFAYYECFKCKQPYYGGVRACGEAQGEFDASELVCGGCSPHAADATCSKHGTQYIEFKCRFCCSIAVYFCFGTTHFCDACHRDPGLMTTMKVLPPCPAGPCGKYLEGSECPLRVKHPPTGEEFALGCGVCRNAETF